jgi:hypothetical protein
MKYEGKKKIKQFTGGIRDQIGGTKPLLGTNHLVLPT